MLRSAVKLRLQFGHTSNVRFRGDRVAGGNLHHNAGATEVRLFDRKHEGRRRTETDSALSKV